MHADARNRKAELVRDDLGDARRLPYQYGNAPGVHAVDQQGELMRVEGPASLPTNDEALEALGRYALRYVKDGRVVGLGTGKAASAFIRALAASGIKVRGVPTSNASEKLAKSHGIPVISLA